MNRPPPQRTLVAGTRPIRRERKVNFAPQDRMAAYGEPTTIVAPAVPARVAVPTPTRRLQRFASRMRALMADDGTGARFAAERQHDDALVRRVARQIRH
jgi:hypothetical protein